MRISDEMTPLLELRFLTKDAEIELGQQVYTSGVGKVYPAGILIGEIEEFKTGPLHGQATVRPAVDMAKMKSVFVVTGTKK